MEATDVSIATLLISLRNVVRLTVSPNFATGEIALAERTNPQPTKSVPNAANVGRQGGERSGALGRKIEIAMPVRFVVHGFGMVDIRRLGVLRKFGDYNCRELVSNPSDDEGDNLNSFGLVIPSSTVKDRSVKRSGWTLIELLAGIFVMTATMVAWMSVSARYGALLGFGAAVIVGSLAVIVVVTFYRWMSALDERSLRDAREKYRDVYRVIATPIDPKVITLPKGAEIKVGDYGWEAGPCRNDGLTYLQGLTRDWTVVWHAGFYPYEIEKVCKKPNSQYDAWHPFWADPPQLPLCPFPVIERETMTIGRPHHSHQYFVQPTAYRPPKADMNGNDSETV